MGNSWTKTDRRRSISESDLKLCPLCGALNHRKNRDCFTCGWTGAFSLDSPTIRVAYLSLKDQFEAVHLRHVSRAKTAPLGDFGVVTNKTPMERLGDMLRGWWRGLPVARRRRATIERETARTPAYPGNELGV